MEILNHGNITFPISMSHKGQQDKPNGGHEQD